MDECCGLKYFPRMVAKIRLHASGKLWEDLHANLGKGSDGACVEFLHVNYDDLKARVLQGGSDEEASQRGRCRREGGARRRLSVVNYLS